VIKNGQRILMKIVDKIMNYVFSVLIFTKQNYLI